MERFGAAVDYEAAPGVPVVSIKAIVEIGGELATVGGSRISSEGMLLKCAAVDVPSLSRSSTFHVDNVEYKVAEFTIDHAGTALVYLGLLQS
jgi:hypothetical protein